MRSVGAGDDSGHVDPELADRILSGRYVVDPERVAAAMLAPDGRRRADRASAMLVSAEALDRLSAAIEELDPAPFQDAA
jgi:hypothetical protein